MSVSILKQSAILCHFIFGIKIITSDLMAFISYLLVHMNLTQVQMAVKDPTNELDTKSTKTAKFASPS